MQSYSAAYYQLATQVAEDHDILAFVEQQPVTQPNLLFAAVQFLTGAEHMPLSSTAFRTFLHKRGKEVATLMQIRRTQTNEVGRCAALLLALPQGPLALVEVGASAGLCLLLDQFCYDYSGRIVGDRQSPVRIRCEARDGAPVPNELPNITWRYGLDLNPMDVRNADDVKWLLACIWPDHQDRRRRLEAALTLAQSNPPPLTRGDLVDALPTLLTSVPPTAQLVVFHSATLPYVPPERRIEFAHSLREASKARDVVWISNEAPRMISEITELAPRQTGSSFLLGRTRFVRGQREDALLALAHPHGAELSWLASFTEE